MISALNVTLLISEKSEFPQECNNVTTVNYLFKRQHQQLLTIDVCLIQS